MAFELLVQKRKLDLVYSSSERRVSHPATRRFFRILIRGQLLLVDAREQSECHFRPSLPLGHRHHPTLVCSCGFRYIMPGLMASRKPKAASMCRSMCLVSYHPSLTWSLVAVLTFAVSAYTARYLVSCMVASGEGRLSEGLPGRQR